jgi:hypothetical protein
MSLPRGNPAMSTAISAPPVPAQHPSSAPHLTLRRPETHYSNARGITKHAGVRGPIQPNQGDKSNGRRIQEVLEHHLEATNHPTPLSSPTVVQQARAFLKKVRELGSPQVALQSLRTQACGRLIFTMDATSSRQPTWDMAVELQAEMFRAASGLEVKLVYFRGASECRQSSWKSDPDQVDHQLVLGRRLHRKVGRLLTPKNPIDVASRATDWIESVRPIGDQTTTHGIIAEGIDCGQPMAGSKLDDKVVGAGGGRRLQVKFNFQGYSSASALIGHQRTACRSRPDHALMRTGIDRNPLRKFE